jgi:hypothetical protein
MSLLRSVPRAKVMIKEYFDEWWPVLKLYRKRRLIRWKEKLSRRRGKMKRRGIPIPPTPLKPPKKKIKIKRKIKKFITKVVKVKKIVIIPKFVKKKSTVTSNSLSDGLDDWNYW